MVGLSGFEPLTSRLSAVRSSQLSYRPVEPLLGCWHFPWTLEWVGMGFQGASGRSPALGGPKVTP